MELKKLLMIVNPAAGRRKSRESLYYAATILSEAGYLLNIRNTSGPGNARALAAEKGGEFDLVVAVGGALPFGVYDYEACSGR